MNFSGFTLKSLGLAVFLGPAFALQAGSLDLVGLYKPQKGGKNCPAVYAKLEIKDDGTWQGDYGVKGTWKFQDSRIRAYFDVPGLFYFAEAKGGKLSWPSPANKKLFCGLTAQGKTRPSLYASAAAGDLAGLRKVLAGLRPGWINVKDALGETALIYASEEGKEEAVKLLLDNMASLENEGAEGITPLSAAARGGQLKVLKLLLSKGASPNHAGPGWTALMHAIQIHELEIVKALLEAHADPNLAAGNGSSPLWLARSTGNNEMVELLLKQGAKEQ